MHGAPAGDPGPAHTIPPIPGAGSPAVLVGRDTELATLWGLFQKAAAGERQVVFIQGEPGIGKTSVVDAFLDGLPASSDGVVIGYGQCVEQHGDREPYMPVLEALERLGHGPARDRLLPVLRAVAPSWLAQIPSLQSPADAEQRRRGDADTTPHRMLREFASLVEAASVDHPLVLVLEDLHSSDHGTVDLVSVLAQRPERARVMLLGTYRPAEAAALDHPVAQVAATLRARHRCTGKIWVGPERKRETLDRFFAEALPPARRREVWAVCVDMWEPFRRSLQAHLPDARLVYDKFHVLRHASEALDETRRAEFFRQGAEARGLVRGKRWLLLRSWATLDRADRQTLRDLFALNRRLAKAHLLKEQLAQLWRYRYAGAARRFLTRWLHALRWQRLPAFGKLGELLTRHLEGILNYCHEPVPFGTVEAINGNIRAMLRRGRGYRDHEYLLLKVQRATATRRRQAA